MDTNMSRTTLENYQARLLAIQESFNAEPNDYLYIYSLGLAGEAGEVANLIKKMIRDGVDIQDKIEKELGDVLAYLTLLANLFGFDLKYIAATNINKLEERRERGTLQGSGDDR